MAYHTSIGAMFLYADQKQLQPVVLSSTARTNDYHDQLMMSPFEKWVKCGYIGFTMLTRCKQSSAPVTPYLEPVRDRTMPPHPNVTSFEIPGRPPPTPQCQKSRASLTGLQNTSHSKTNITPLSSHTDRIEISQLPQEQFRPPIHSTSPTPLPQMDDANPGSSYTFVQEGSKRRKVDRADLVVESAGQESQNLMGESDDDDNELAAEITTATPTQTPDLEATPAPRKRGRPPKKKRQPRKGKVSDETPSTQTVAGVVKQASVGPTPTKHAEVQEMLTRSRRNKDAPTPLAAGLAQTSRKKKVFSSDHLRGHFLIQDEHGNQVESSTMPQAFIDSVNREMDKFDIDAQDVARGGVYWYEHSTTVKCVNVRVLGVTPKWTDGKGYSCADCVRKSRCCIVINNQERAILLPLAKQFREGEASASIAYYVRQTK